MRSSDSLKHSLMRPVKIKFIQKDKEGVASVVGTIMALLVFLTFLTIFTTTYVPVTMKENERSHMNSVLNEFGGLKGGIDNMIVYTSLTNNPSFPTFQNVDLGADGIPAFASPTAGFLSLYAKDTGHSRIQAWFNTTNGADVYCNGGGAVEMYAPNRYYVQQWVAYENGAIIIKQEDGQIIRAQPGITFNKDASALNLVFSQIDIIGPVEMKGGTDNVGINSQVVYVERLSYNLWAGDPSVNFTFTTKYGPAYYTYFNATLNGMGLFKNDAPGVHHFAMPVAGERYNKTYTNQDVDPITRETTVTNTDQIFWSISMTYLGGDMYKVVLSLRNPTAHPGVVSYSHSYVNINLAD